MTVRQRLKRRFLVLQGLLWAGVAPMVAIEWVIISRKASIAWQLAVVAAVVGLFVAVKQALLRALNCPRCQGTLWEGREYALDRCPRCGLDFNDTPSSRIGPR